MSIPTKLRERHLFPSMRNLYANIIRLPATLIMKLVVPNIFQMFHLLFKSHVLRLTSTPHFNPNFNT